MATTLPRTTTATATAATAATGTGAGGGGGGAGAQEVHADGSATSAVTATTSSSSSTSSSSGSGGGGGSSSVNIVVAKYGARALENGGPLQDLRAILYQHMRPWRPSQTLHIGLVDPLIHSFMDMPGGGAVGDGGGGRFVDHKQLYFQWCTLSKEYEQDPQRWIAIPKAYQHMTTKRGGGGGEEEVQMIIPDEIAFSRVCETLYVGVLFG